MQVRPKAMCEIVFDKPFVQKGNQNPRLERNLRILEVLLKSDLKKLSKKSSLIQIMALFAGPQLA